MHAALMHSGFLAMVIAVERAVAVHLPSAFAAPVAAGLANVVLSAAPFEGAAALGIIAAMVSVAVRLVVLKRQRASHAVWLLLASCAWLVGKVCSSRPATDRPTPCHGGFLCRC